MLLEVAKLYCEKYHCLFEIQPESYMNCINTIVDLLSNNPMDE